MKDYGKALNSFSQALLSPDAGLQSKVIKILETLFTSVARRKRRMTRNDGLDERAPALRAKP